ncbi:MAG: hypothetical protein ACLVKI_13390 [Gordonibacter urolithinfaciens]
MTLAETRLRAMIIALDVAAARHASSASFEEETASLCTACCPCGYDHIADDRPRSWKREAEILEAWSKRTV